MTIPRLCVEAPLAAGAGIALDGPRAHYLRAVMRRRTGDPVLLFNGRDGEWLGRLEPAAAGKGQAKPPQSARKGISKSVPKDALQLRVEARTRAQVAAPGPWLAFAPIKRQGTELILQKATELGASRLLPVITARAGAPPPRADRARDIVREAAEQCGRLDLPTVAEPVSLADLLHDWPPERPLHACLETDPADGAAAPLAKALAQDADGAGFLIGPEGGFAPRDLEIIAAHPSIIPVGLGPRLLRAETAAIAALSCWQALRGDGAARPPGPLRQALRPGAFGRPTHSGHKDSAHGA